MGYILLPSKRKSNFSVLLGIPNATCIPIIYTPFFSGMSKWRNNISIDQKELIPPGQTHSKKLKEFQSKKKPMKKMFKYFEIYSAQPSCTKSDLTYVS